MQVTLLTTAPRASAGSGPGCWAAQASVARARMVSARGNLVLMVSKGVGLLKRIDSAGLISKAGLRERASTTLFGAGLIQFADASICRRERYAVRQSLTDGSSPPFQRRGGGKKVVS